MEIAEFIIKEYPSTPRNWPMIEEEHPEMVKEYGNMRRLRQMVSYVEVHKNKKLVKPSVVHKPKQEPKPEPPPIVNHCPHCGFNLRAFSIAYAVALKH